MKVSPKRLFPIQGIKPVATAQKNRDFPGQNNSQISETGAAIYTTDPVAPCSGR
jgi:hypothetical protein